MIKTQLNSFKIYVANIQLTKKSLYLSSILGTPRDDHKSKTGVPTERFKPSNTGMNPSAPSYLP